MGEIAKGQRIFSNFKHAAFIAFGTLQSILPDI